MSSYKDLLAQREALEKQIEEARTREYSEVLSDVKQKIADYGFSAAELGLARGAKLARGAAKPLAGVAIKYRDPETGATWSGRGKPPRWIAGQDRERFAV